MTQTDTQPHLQDTAPAALAHSLLYCGTVTPLLFFGTTLLCGFILGDYNHLTRMVSELGALRTPTQYLFTAGLVVCALLSVAFIVGLLISCRHAKLSTVPVWLLLSYSVSIGGAGIFPFPTRLHLLVGMPSVLLFLSPLASLLLWRKTNSPSNLQVMAGFAFGFMTLGFLTFFPSVLSSYIGLKQRLFHFGWCVWFTYLSTAFLGMWGKGNPLRMGRVLGE